MTWAHFEIWHRAPNFVGSALLHKDDLDHVGQLTRSKHEAHGGEDNHLATAMDP
jgi:hypothetical protein